MAGHRQSANAARKVRAPRIDRDSALIVMAHVLTGSLVLAATLVLALEIRRCEQSQTGQ
jgi:hypothetical protein